MPRFSIATAAVFGAALITFTGAALADVGPRRSCPDGTHPEYLYGHKCVKNGFHLEEKAGGGAVEVSDSAVPTASVATSASAAVTAHASASSTSAGSSAASAEPAPTTPATSSTSESGPSASALATQPTSPPAAKRGCACELAGGSDGSGVALGASALVALVAGFAARGYRRHARPR